MNSTAPQLFALYARVLTYPGEETAAQARQLAGELEAAFPEAAPGAREFAQSATASGLSDLEEAYTRSFEVQPASALEVGWHLFGEEYARGLFLVRMRQELRRHAIAESTELPDHLTCVLALLEVFDHHSAQEFVRSCVLPAVARIEKRLLAAKSLWGSLITSLKTLLKTEYALEEPDADDASWSTSANAPCDPDDIETDPAGAAGACDCHGPALVPLETAIQTDTSSGLALSSPLVSDRGQP